MIKVINNTKEKINKLLTKKNILIFTIIIALIMLVPIIWASLYTHPSADDFNYGVRTINKIQTEGLLEVLKGSFAQMLYSYKSWQGTYSAIILFSLNPSVFGDNLYFLTTVIIIGMLLFSLYYFLNQIIHKLLKLDKISFYIILIIFFLLSIETIPSKIEGLYWWNGSSYYMLFFALELIEIGLLIKRYFLNKRTKLNFAILNILIFIIGGGNFIVALQQIIILFFLNLILLINKKDKNAITLFIVSLVGLGISAIAPGNAVRAASSISMNPIKAIIYSFIYAMEKIFTWINPLNISIICLLVGLLYPTYQKINYKFKHPLLFILILYGIFSAEFTPTLYSQSSLGAGRLWNIMYISLMLLLCITLYYIIGFIRNSLIEKKVLDKKSENIIAQMVKKNRITIFLLFVIIIAINMVININYLTSYQTYKILRNGEAKQYDKEWKKRMNILYNDKIKDVEFKSLSVYPSPIVYEDFSEDETSWLNTPAAEIYDKNYIKIIK